MNAKKCSKIAKNRPIKKDRSFCDFWVMLVGEREKNTRILYNWWILGFTSLPSYCCIYNCGKKELTVHRAIEVKLPIL